MLSDNTGSSVPDFNPRSREGSDGNAEVIASSDTGISIHAPARGATSSYPFSRSYSSFQSTLPRGERRLSQESFLVQLPISIHAPARGATIYILLTMMMRIFQSTLPRGERLDVLLRSALTFVFQSTLPRGERRPFS